MSREPRDLNILPSVCLPREVILSVLRPGRKGFSCPWDLHAARFWEFDGEGSELTGWAPPSVMGTDLRQGPGNPGPSHSVGEMREGWGGW